jgi:Tol biopolymer transport system component
MLSDNYRGGIRGLGPGEPAERNLSWLVGSTAADLSRDGRQVLFYEEGSNPDHPDGKEVFTTFLRGTDGTDAVMLGEGRALALSPDGKRALVVRPFPEPVLVLLPTGAGEPRPLPRGDASILIHRRATFFPNGKRILFTTDEKTGKARSYTQDLEGGGPPTPFGDDGLRALLVSPDGLRVAAKTIEGNSVICRTDGGGRPRPIEGSLPDDLLVQWSSDGRTIYVKGGEDQPLTLYRLDLATGRRERWKELAPPDLTGFLRFGPRMRGVGVSVTPDGRFYAYTFFTDSSRLVLGEVGPGWWK